MKPASTKRTDSSDKANLLRKALVTHVVRNVACDNHEIEAARGEKAIVALARANIYNLLASAYAEPPSLQVVRAIADGTLLRAFRDVGLDHVAAELDAFVPGRDAKDLLEEMEIEYTRLFVAPGPDYVPPYQSMYSDELSDGSTALANDGKRLDKRQLWGDSAVAAERMYLEAGLAVTGELREVPDHIGLELQFLQHLCGREAEALNTGRILAAEESVRLQLAFLETQLAPWIDRFCQAVGNAARHPFYRGIANLTLGFVLSDVEELRRQASVIVDGAMGSGDVCSV